MGASGRINSQLNMVVGSIALRARVHESMGRDIKPAWRVKEGTMGMGDPDRVRLWRICIRICLYLADLVDLVCSAAGSLCLRDCSRVLGIVLEINKVGYKCHGIHWSQCREAFAQWLSGDRVSIPQLSHSSGGRCWSSCFIVFSRISLQGWAPVILSDNWL